MNSKLFSTGQWVGVQQINRTAKSCHGIAVSLIVKEILMPDVPGVAFECSDWYPSTRISIRHPRLYARNEHKILHLFCAQILSAFLHKRSDNVTGKGARSAKLRTRTICGKYRRVQKTGLRSDEFLPIGIVHLLNVQVLPLIASHFT